MKVAVKKYLSLFLSMLQLSAFTFGGGYVIVTLMRSKFVNKLHWLTEDEMPAHIHDRIVSTNNTSSLTRGFGTYTEMGSGTNAYGPWFGTGYNYQGIAQTNKAGEGQAHNNLQPYRAAYIWRRTA